MPYFWKLGFAASLSLLIYACGGDSNERDSEEEEINTAPTAIADVTQIAEDTRLVDFNPLANDNGDILTLVAATPTTGQVVINNDQTLTYTPSDDFLVRSSSRIPLATVQRQTTAL